MTRLPKKDLSGQRLGILSVIERYDVVGNGETRYRCICDCGNEIVVRRSRLKYGAIQSCGCINNINYRKLNKYDLSGDYGIGYTSNTGVKFYFDKDDFDKISKYTWFENDQGYILACVHKNTKFIRLHRLIMNAQDSEEIDHINTLRCDNRKINLRLCNKQLNGINRPCNRNSKTGIKGVSKIKNGYMARISKDYKSIYIGTFGTKEKAEQARKDKEIELFGEFAYKGVI